MPRTTQETLRKLALLQATTTRAQLAQTELALEIERNLAAGGEIEDGEFYFDSSLMLARTKRVGRAVGE